MNLQFAVAHCRLIIEGEKSTAMNAPLSISQFDEVLSTARSVRRNLDFERHLEREVLYDCIDVAVQAPTGVDGERWRFVVVDEAGRKAELAGLYTEVLEDLLADRGMTMKPTHRALTSRLHQIPAMIFVCVDGLPADESVPAQVAFYGSVMPAAWSLMLALRARQIGATWTSLLSARQSEVGDILGMPGNSMHTVMLPAGYMKGAVMKRADRAGARQVTFFNQWGEP